MIIIVDTREQLPLDFTSYDDVIVRRSEIWPGDYTLCGASNFLAIERKSVSDLVGTMKTGYAGFSATTPKRFDRELKALRGYNTNGCRAFVLVEPDGLIGQDALYQIKAHAYRSAIEPSKILAFVRSIRYGWNVPVVFSKSRQHSAEIVYRECKLAETVRRGFRAFDDSVVNETEKI